MGKNNFKSLKIINILHHTPLPIHFGSREELSKNVIFEYEETGEKDSWVGFFPADHHATTAFETLKRTNNYLIECWRPYSSKLTRIYSRTVYGVVHKIFPCRVIRYPFWGVTLWSQDMFEEIIRENEKFNILLHIHDGHSKFIVKLLLKLERYNIPVIYQHRSSKFSIFKYRNLPWYKKPNIANLVDFLRQKRALDNIDLYLSDSLYERRFVSGILKFNRFVSYKQGIDFKTFYPAEKSEIPKLKEKLGIKSDSFVLLYVGRFYAEKNVDLLIDVFSELKSKIINLELLIVGGYKTDEFYPLAKKKNIKIFERVPEKELLKFYQIADIYIMPVNNFTVHYFGGFGNAPIQALACNVPVISDNLIHFPGTPEERNRIGKMMFSKEKLKTAIIDIYSNTSNYSDCREITSKYYDLEKTMTFLIKSYDELFGKYYFNQNERN